MIEPGTISHNARDLPGEVVAERLDVVADGRAGSAAGHRRRAADDSGPGSGAGSARG